MSNLIKKALLGSISIGSATTYYLEKTRNEISSKIAVAKAESHQQAKDSENV